MSKGPDIPQLLENLRRQFRRCDSTGPNALVLGVTGSVAAGKTTFAESLRNDMRVWPEHPAVEIVSTDGFLFPNPRLAEKGLSHRKGFPESFDVEALRSVLRAARSRKAVSIPHYSHVTYDIDPANPLELEPVDIVIVDGLHLGRLKFDTDGSRLIDRLIYLDASETDIEGWFGTRLLALMRVGRDDPRSFYHAFREMDDEAARAFISRVWNGINLPNLREHIVRDRELADIVITKGASHEMISMRGA